VAQNNVAKTLVAVSPIENVSQVTTRGRDIDHGPLFASCGRRQSGDDGADLLGDKDMSGAALSGRHLQGCLSERRLVAVRVGLEQQLEDVRLHG
jgi:hypothetical protein